MRAPSSRLKVGDRVVHSDYYFETGGLRTRPWAVGLEGVVTGKQGNLYHVRFPGQDATFRIPRVNLKKVGSQKAHASRVAARRSTSHKHGPRVGYHGHQRCPVCGV